MTTDTERSSSRGSAERGFPVALLSCLGDVSSRCDRLQFANPLVLDDSVRIVLASARRLLEFERFLDRMELIKGKKGSLPQRVEERIAHAFVQAQADAADVARAAVDAISELQYAGALEQMVPEVAHCLDGLGDVRVDQLLQFELSHIQEFVEDRGMDHELLQWAVKYIDVNGLVLSGDGDRILARRGEQRSALIGRNPSFLPTVEGIAFVDGQLFRHAAEDPKAMIDDISHVSPYGGMLILAKSLLERYEQRSRMTALHGVQVLPTGFDPFTIAIIVLIVIAVISAVIIVLCLLGAIDINSDACKVAAGAFFGSLFILCVMGGGTVTPGGPGDVGALCTLKLNGDEPPVG